MTLDELLANYRDKYGNAWHLAALDRFLHLYTLSDWDYFSLHALPAASERRIDEYSLLRQWVGDMVEKGVRAEEE